VNLLVSQYRSICSYSSVHATGVECFRAMQAKPPGQRIELTFIDFVLRLLTEKMFAFRTAVLVSLLSSVRGAIDRSTFSNLRATEQHDGYMKFDIDFEFPLSLLWKKSNVQCYFSTCCNTPVFASNSLYCLTNAATSANSSIAECLCYMSSPYCALL